MEREAQGGGAMTCAAGGKGASGTPPGAVEATGGGAMGLGEAVGRPTEIPPVWGGPLSCMACPGQAQQVAVHE